MASAEVRQTKGTLERENAGMGIFLTLEEPTGEMRMEATMAGMYRVWERDFPRIQIVGIRELSEKGRVNERAGEQMLDEARKR